MILTSGFMEVCQQEFHESYASKWKEDEFWCCWMIHPDAVTGNDFAYACMWRYSFSGVSLCIVIEYGVNEHISMGFGGSNDWSVR